MPRPRFRMFIDDTGEVDNAATNDDQRRFASITGVIFEWKHYYHTFVPKFRDLRSLHFGLTKHNRPPILQRRAIIGREGKFVVLKEAANEAKWNADSLQMYKTYDYKVVTVCIDKVAFYYHHPGWRNKIYLLLIQNAIERYYYFLKSMNGCGDVMAESLGPNPDQSLKARYQRVYENGTEHLSDADLHSVLTSKEIKIKRKKDDIAGLQLADLLAKPSFDKCRSIYTGAPSPRGFVSSLCDILENEKYYRLATGKIDGVGRIWRPRIKTAP